MHESQSSHNLQDRYSYCPHCTDEDIEAQRDCITSSKSHSSEVAPVHPEHKLFSFAECHPLFLNRQGKCCLLPCLCLRPACSRWVHMVPRTTALLWEAFSGSSEELMASSLTPTTLGTADSLCTGTFGAVTVSSASLSVLAPAVSLLAVRLVPRECLLDGHLALVPHAVDLLV